MTNYIILNDGKYIMEIKTYYMGRMKEYNKIGVNEMMRVFNNRTRIRHFHITWVRNKRHNKIYC